METHSEAQAEQPEESRPPRSSGLLATAVDIFASPGEAFTRIRERPSILFPLLLVLVPTTLISIWYMQIVDYEWFIDDTLSRFGEMTEQQVEAMRAAYQNQSPMMSTFSAILGSVISTCILYVIHAGYLTLVSLMTGDGYRFRHWFSLLSWTNLPMLLVALVMAVNIALSPNGQISLYDANALSLASLGLQTDTASFQFLFDMFSLPMIWALGLLVMGYQQWVKCGWVRATLVVLAPYLLMIGIVAYFTLS